MLPAVPATTRLADCICTCCSCLCDDIHVTLQDGRIVAAENACVLGEPWFLESPAASPTCFIAGREATLEQAVIRAAEILAAARYPLVYGFRDCASEAVRQGVFLAEGLGGVLDTVVSSGHGTAITAFHSVGKISCSLGEIRNRGDLVVCWGSDPLERHPRLFSRSMPPRGEFIPYGEAGESRRPGRTLVVVDVKRTASANEADLFIQIKPETDFEALWALRAIIAGQEVDGAKLQQCTGVPLTVWQDLAGRMKRSRFGSLLYGMGLMHTRGRHLNSEAVFALTRDLNDHTRFISRSIKGRGNVVGADNVLAWMTGFAQAVNFTRGYPRYGPGEYSADELLARGEPDAAIVVAADAQAVLGDAAMRHLRRIPAIIVGSRPSSLDAGAAVFIPTARCGIESGGTVYRMDEVPLQLRPSLLTSLPDEAAVLESVLASVRRIGDSH